MDERHQDYMDEERENYMDEHHEECIACLESFPRNQLIRTRCDHYYCADDITQLVLTAITDPTQFPAQCCNRVIPIKRIRPFVMEEIINQHNAKKMENDTHAADRVYCSNGYCARFLPPDLARDGRVKCPDCRVITCVRCKRAEHGGTNCAPVKKEKDRELLKLAGKEGWKECARCGIMVERSSGCSHITCVCGYQFCYICGHDWLQGACTCFEALEAELFREQRIALGLPHLQFQDLLAAGLPAPYRIRNQPAPQQIPQPAAREHSSRRAGREEIARLQAPVGDINWGSPQADGRFTPVEDAVDEVYRDFDAEEFEAEEFGGRVESPPERMSREVADNTYHDVDYADDANALLSFTRARPDNTNVRVIQRAQPYMPERQLHGHHQRRFQAEHQQRMAAMAQRNPRTRAGIQNRQAIGDEFDYGALNAARLETERLERDMIMLRRHMLGPLREVGPNDNPVTPPGSNPGVDFGEMMEAQRNLMDLQRNENFRQQREAVEEDFRQQMEAVEERFRSRLARSEARKLRRAERNRIIFGRHDRGFHSRQIQAPTENTAGLRVPPRFTGDLGDMVNVVGYENANNEPPRTAVGGRNTGGGIIAGMAARVRGMLPFANSVNGGMGGQVPIMNDEDNFIPVGPPFGPRWAETDGRR